MRNCEKQVFEMWRGKQDKLYQVKINLFCGLVLFTAKVHLWRSTFCWMSGLLFGEYVNGHIFEYFTSFLLNWAWHQNLLTLEMARIATYRFCCLRLQFETALNVIFCSPTGSLIDVMIKVHFLFTGQLKTWAGKCYPRWVICVHILIIASRILQMDTWFHVVPAFQCGQL